MKELTFWALAMAILFGICLANGLAETLTYANGAKLEGIEIVKVEPDGIRYMRPNGAGKAMFAKLSAEDQKRFGYNPEEADRHKKQKVHAEGLADAALAAMQKQKQSADRQHREITQTARQAEAAMEAVAREQRIRQIEDAMATVINETTNRGFKPGKRMTEDDKKIQRTETGWTPYSPVEHPDLSRTMRGRDLMDEWKKLNK